MDNYKTAMEHAQKLFLTYDSRKIARKFSLKSDENYLYLTVLGSLHRLDLRTGSLERLEKDCWVSANSFNEIMTVLDLLCDAEENRHLAGKWQSTQNFGHQFHRNLLEDARDPLAAAFDREPEAFQAACTALGGKPMPHGDLGYRISLFQELEIGVCFWHSDEEFPPQLRYFWDENALMYLKYETMHYALAVLKNALIRQAFPHNLTFRS